MNNKRFKPDFIVVHHTAGPVGRTLEDIRRTHVEGNGWDDVGYHFVVEATGLVRIGRAETRPGAHLKGANGKTLGVCVVGTFNMDLPTGDQQHALVYLLAMLCRKHGIPSANVIGHREGPSRVPGAEPTRKSCPGKMVDLDELRANVAEVLGEEAMGAVT